MAVVGVCVWLETQPARDEAQARENLRENVEVLRDRLGEAAADGSLPDTEIVHIFPPSKSAKGFVGVRRQGEAVTVVAEVLGQGPPRAFVFVYERLVTGCYAFEVPPPASGAPQPAIRQLPQEACAAGAATLPDPSVGINSHMKRSAPSERETGSPPHRVCPNPGITPVPSEAVNMCCRFS